MKKALVVASLVLLSGCLDYDEVLTLAADGSGSVHVDFTVDLAFSEALRKLQVPPGEKAPEDADDPYKMMVTKEEILKNVQGVPGVEVRPIKVEEPAPNKTHVVLDVDFKSLAALRKTTGFANRELAFEEKDGSVLATYKVDARFLKDLGLLTAPGDPEPTTDLEKKMRKTVEDATAGAKARFTVRFPAKPVAIVAGAAVSGDEKAVRVEVPANDPRAHAALAKDPIVSKATLAKKDAAGLLAASEAKAPAEKPAPTSPAPKKDDE